MSAWPQYLIALWLAAQVFHHLVSDLKEPAGTSERVTSVLASFIVCGLLVFVLWAGGWWAPLIG